MSAGGRWCRHVAVAVTCVAVLGLAACSPGGQHKADGPGAAVLPARAPAALGSGTLYLLLGNQDVSANLWRVDLPSGRTRQLTMNPSEDGVSNFSASSAGLVLGDARSSVDQAEFMRDRKPHLLGGGVGDSPQINAAGQVVDVASAEQGVRHGPWSHDRLLFWDSPVGPYRTIYQTKPGNLVSTAWNPAGDQILLINGPDDGAYTRLFTANRLGRIVRRIVTLEGAGPDTYAWGPRGLAIGYFSSRRSKILSPSGQVTRVLPAGWVPACWNPAGSELLMVTHDQRRIGIWLPARPGRVRDLGALPGQAFQECSWTARPAVGT